MNVSNKVARFNCWSIAKPSVHLQSSYHPEWIFYRANVFFFSPVFYTSAKPTSKTQPKQNPIYLHFILQNDVMLLVAFLCVWAFLRISKCENNWLGRTRNNNRLDNSSQRNLFILKWYLKRSVGCANKTNVWEMTVSFNWTNTQHISLKCIYSTNCNVLCEHSCSSKFVFIFFFVSILSKIYWRIYFTFLSMQRQI